jgi:hypothetical protein
MFFDYDTVYQKYDNITFNHWAEIKKVPDDFFDIILKPAVSVTLNDRDKFSAAEMLTFMQIYFLTSSKSDDREVVTKNFNQSILYPWTEYLKKQNVK